MNEYQFVRKNKSRWKTLDEQLSSNRLNADELTETYIQLTDDLAYAQTFFPDSDTAQYLNAVATKLHKKIYLNRSGSLQQLWDFFRYEVPSVCYESRKAIWASLILFCLFVAVGFFSGQQDEDMLRVIIGDSYVRLTESNIEEGDPLGIYGKSERSEMFVQIASNNIQVSFLAYVLGILANIGTLAVMLNNGVMLGAFLQFFYAQDLFGLAFSTIFLHGALEISAIVLAGAAGFMVGNGLLFPGTYSRGRSLILAVRRSMKLIFSLVPVFIVAAFIESFLTRHYLDLPGAVRWLVIILSFAFIAWYYFIYPLRFKDRAEVRIPLKTSVHE